MAKLDMLETKEEVEEDIEVNNEIMICISICRYQRVDIMADSLS